MQESFLHRHPILALWTFSGLSGAVTTVVLVLVSGQPFAGGLPAAFLAGAVTAVFHTTLFHVPPFRQLVRFGARIGGAVEDEMERSLGAGTGCVGIVLLPFTVVYYLLSWPGIKLAEKLGYVRMVRDKE